MTISISRSRFRFAWVVGLGIVLGNLPGGKAAIYTVNSNADSGPGTLRDALLAANTNPGSDSITFNLALSSLEISPLTDLPEITDPVTINGTTQPGFTKTPLVVLQGTGSGYGLRLSASGSTVTAVRVANFNSGIRVTAPSCTLDACHVISNALNGILLEASGTTVRGCYAGANFTGIRLQSGETNSLLGNFIGIHPSTGHAHGNSHGVMVFSSRHFIGGTGEDDGNVISGNSYDGISIGEASYSNSIRGNFIGTDIAGSAAVPNEVGVRIAGSFNVVGGSKVGSKNVIAGNRASGILLTGYTPVPGWQNKVEGNFIGTDSSGSFAVPNGTGIVMETFFAYSNRVGNALATGRNIIAGNHGPGIYLDQAYGTWIKGNYIGTDVSGTVALPNGTHGVHVDAAPGTTVGGTGAEAGNLIAGNDEHGIYLVGPSVEQTTIEGNWIGVNVAGTHGLANGGSGVRIANGSAVRIGGTTAGAGNVISGNAVGIYCSASDHIVMQGNLVGTTPSGLAALGNTLNGIIVLDSTSNTIGGVTASSGNTLSGNGSYGIALHGPDSAGHVVQGNRLGLGADGETPVPNGVAGLLLSGVRDVQVGGDLLVGGGNRISANAVVGIHVMNTSGCFFHGNWIGSHPVGPDFAGNAGHGIYISGSSSNNSIGDTVWSLGNVIAYNDGSGIVVGDAPSSASTVGNRIGLNWIHHNGGLGIDLGADGHTPNDTVIGGDPDTGPNNLQNYPVITNVFVDGTSLRLQGYLKSGMNQAYQINFYGNPQFDPSGYGEGELMIGLTNLSTAPLDTGYFDFSAPAPAPMPDYFTATATHLSRGDTSEFSHFAMLDTDGDGMPDGWERDHFGHSTIADPLGDQDHDGATNLDEFIADTNPTNAAERLRLTTFAISTLTAPTGILAEVAFDTSPYRRYLLEIANAPSSEPQEWEPAPEGYRHGIDGVMTGQHFNATTTPNTLLRIRARLP